MPSRDDILRQAGTSFEPVPGVVIPARPASATTALSELAYAQITGNVTGIVGTTFGTGTTIVTAPATVFAATAILVHFFTPLVRVNAVQPIDFHVAEGATDLGLIAQYDTTVASNGIPLSGDLRIVPTAGSHTYSIVARVGGGSGSVFAGTGGVGATAPAFIRITQ